MFKLKKILLTLLCKYILLYVKCSQMGRKYFLFFPYICATFA